MRRYLCAVLRFISKSLYFLPTLLKTKDKAWCNNIKLNNEFNYLEFFIGSWKHLVNAEFVTKILNLPRKIFPPFHSKTSVGFFSARCWRLAITWPLICQIPSSARSREHGKLCFCSLKNFCHPVISANCSREANTITKWRLEN